MRRPLTPAQSRVSLRPRCLGGETRGYTGVMRTLAVAALLLASCAESKPPPPRLETLTTPDGHPRSKRIAQGQSFLPGDYLVPGYVTVLKFIAPG